MINKINNTSGNYRSLVPGLHNSSCGEDCNCESCNPFEKNKTKTEIFIEKAKKVHGENRYDYSKVSYVNSRTKVTIICKKHNKEFLQSPNKHLSGRGCPICSITNRNDKNRCTLEEFIEKAKKVHGENRYDYSKVNYVNNETEVTIICPKHGIFSKIPREHTSKSKKSGCPKCSIINKTNRFAENFIKRVKEIFGEDLYDYSKVNYINYQTKVSIVCKKHGIFLQTPRGLINKLRGCPKCNNIKSKLEINVENALFNNNIKFETQISWDWLKYKSLQYVDFYLPEYNIVIECQGRQHFEKVTSFGGEDNFKVIQERDKNKLKLCREHGINILYYSNLGKNYPYPYNVITDINNLINEIKKVGLTNQS